MKNFDVYPIFDIEPIKGKGNYVWDKNGIKYLDFYGGHAVISVGHTHPYYVDKIQDQLNKIGFYSNSVSIPQQEELAEKLGRISGYPSYNLFLCNSGAEANENALKLASFVTGRKKIISFSMGFHGRTSLAVEVTDNPSIKAPANISGNAIILPFNDEGALESAMDETVAAVIIEGIQGVGGVYEPTTSFLRAAQALCNKVGALLVLDEVQSGYGRSGKFFAHQYSEITPDLITTAKGMGNGFPIAGVLIHPRFQAKHGMLGTTFGGNHLACAAGIAVLDIIEKENLIQNAEKVGEYLVNKIKDLPGVKEIRGKGLMIGIELEFPSGELRNDLLFTHRIFTGSSSNKNTIRILPALNITEKEMDSFVEAFTVVLQNKLVKQ
jgi:acetylornithine/N-succinyldiaminopimelate aminotransferase